MHTSSDRMGISHVMGQNCSMVADVRAIGVHAYDTKREKDGGLRDF